MHVDHMASACIHIMNGIDFKDLTIGMQEVKNTHINIGTAKDCTIKDLAHAVKQAVGFNGEIVFDATKPDGTPRKVLDVSRLKALGWEPKISLDHGIQETIAYFEANYN